MTSTQILITVAILVLATVITRSLPFLVFSNSKRPPDFIVYLGKALPPSVFALLFVYCLKGVKILSYPYGIPEAIALAVVVLLHLWKRQMLLSISVGTIVYMILVQIVF